jgi:hypothetical protein
MRGGNRIKSGFVRSATHLALVALFLRAFIPAGFMPEANAAQGGVRLVICAAHGISTIVIGGAPEKQDSEAAKKRLCPFSAAAYAPLPVPESTVTPLAFGGESIPLPQAPLLACHASACPLGSRAPPAPTRA